MGTKSEEPGAGNRAHRVELTRVWNFPGRAPPPKCERRERARARRGGERWGGYGLRVRSKRALGAGWNARLSRASLRALERKLGFRARFSGGQELVLFYRLGLCSPFHFVKNGKVFPF